MIDKKYKLIQMTHIVFLKQCKDMTENDSVNPYLVTDRNHHKNIW